LKAEAAFQSQTEHDAALKAEADPSHKCVLSQQQHCPSLPATNANGDVPLFKQLVKKFGSGKCNFPPQRGKLIAA
jgi:hypothetical protein